MTRNVDLLRAVADQIERHPESYCQRFWGNDCGTIHCIAGHAAHLAGLSDSRDDLYCPWSSVINEDGETEPTRDAAARLLGLTIGEASILFDQDWRPHESVPRALRDIASGADVTDVGEIIEEEEDDDE